MSEKKFEKVPQVEIDGKKFHESAQVSFGFKREIQTENIDGNVKTTRIYKLMKYVVVRDKVMDETVVRQEEGGAGKVIILNQMDIETKKEMKRLELL